MNYGAFSGQVFYQHGAFWVTVAVAIFAILAGRQISRLIGGMLDGRAASVSAALAEAAQLKTEAEAMLAAARARQVQAEEDARQILATAHIEATSLAASLAADAEATAKRRERMAIERIAAAEASAVAEIRAAAIDIATAAAKSMLADTFDAQADGAMIDRAISAAPAALRG
ncbi:F0F1 ATP synthase subunit B [Acidocella sp.]|uniref:F0F1 ATP synthase subunit B family protein n=1 Tax=Acidocella sp. TaxID=50710 RepID=UPI00262B9A82|nr:F0F1 ATP synthase subunit B [Acidocella sp.]